MDPQAAWDALIAASRNTLSQHLPQFKIPDRFFPWPEIEQGMKPRRPEFQELARMLAAKGDS